MHVFLFDFFGEKLNCLESCMLSLFLVFKDQGIQFGFYLNDLRLNLALLQKNNILIDFYINI